MPHVTSTATATATATTTTTLLLVNWECCGALWSRKKPQLTRSSETTEDDLANNLLLCIWPRVCCWLLTSARYSLSTLDMFVSLAYFLFVLLYSSTFLLLFLKFLRFLTVCLLLHWLGGVLVKTSDSQLISTNCYIRFTLLYYTKNVALQRSAKNVESIQS